MGLSLLAHGSMPLKYWDEAFLAVTYLINRLPTKILNFSSPLERLFHEKPHYRGLRSFRCACWPNLQPFNTHKLQFRSKQCVFLGYSNMHKWFKCLNDATGRVYISGDVVFDELVYPFSKLNPNAGVHLQSKMLLLPNHIQPNNLPTPGVKLLDCSNINAFVISVTANAPLSSGQTTEISTSNDATCSEGNPILAGLGGMATESIPPAVVGSAPSTDSPTSAGFNPRGEVPAIAVWSVRSPVNTSGGASLGSTLTRAREATLGGHAPVPDFSTLALSVPAHSPATDAIAASTAVFPSVSSVPLPAAPVRPSTRLQHGIRKPKVYTDGTICYGLLNSSGEPNHIDEALDDSRWKSAMDQEYNALPKNNTLALDSEETGSESY
jgi:hypothetical protein